MYTSTNCKQLFSLYNTRPFNICKVKFPSIQQFLLSKRIDKCRHWQNLGSKSYNGSKIFKISIFVISPIHSNLINIFFDILASLLVLSVRRGSISSSRLISLTERRAPITGITQIVIYRRLIRQASSAVRKKPFFSNIFKNL